jgi:hypothetical protein
VYEARLCCVVAIKRRHDRIADLRIEYGEFDDAGAEQEAVAERCVLEDFLFEMGSNKLAKRPLSLTCSATWTNAWMLRRGAKSANVADRPVGICRNVSNFDAAMRFRRRLPYPTDKSRE